MGIDIGGIFNPSAAVSWAQNTVTQGAQATAGLASNAIQWRSDAQDAGRGAMSWVGDQGTALKGAVDDQRTLLSNDADRRGGVLGALEHVASFQIGVNEGVVMGAADAVGGVVKLADGAAKVTDPIEWMTDPQGNIDRLTTTGNTVTALNDLTRPEAWITQPDQNIHTATALWDGLTQGYREGDVAQGIGRGIFDIGSLAIGVGEARAAVAGTEAASGVAREVGVVGNATQKGELLSGVDAVSSSSARALPEWLRGADSAPRALPAAPKPLELTAGPDPGGPTLSQVRRTPFRGAAGEEWVARGYETPLLQQHLRVPVGDTPLGPITGGGGRFIDVASVNGGLRVSAREVKNFRMWSTSPTGQAMRHEVELTGERAQQVIKDAWLRDHWDEARLLQDDPMLRNARGFDPHYEFVGASPSQAYQELLAKAGIPWNTFS
jgi:hypothetical protein